MTVLRFIVPPEWDQKPLGAFLRAAHGVSGTTLKRAKRMENGITHAGRPWRTVDPVRAGEEVCLILDDGRRDYRPCAADVPVLYEDGDFVAFEKPAGLAVHPSRGHPYDTLANVFAAREETRGLVFRPLTRLDRDTSGIVLAAKNAHAAKNAVLTEKCYAALLAGAPPQPEGTIDAPIGRESEGAQRRCVRPDGQPARTRWRVLAANGTAALALFWLETGRTHQIRVHAAHLGCPVLGDPLYGGGSPLLGRQALHCMRLRFLHPLSGEEITVVSAPPQEILQAARQAGLAPEAALRKAANLL